MSTRRPRQSGEHTQLPPEAAAAPGASPGPPAPAGGPPASIAITHPGIEGYLEGLFASTEPVLLEMERLGREESFPIVGPLVGRLLRQLACTLSARDIFEMGSGFGYSTYFLAQAVGAGGRVVHTDLDPRRSDKARALLTQAGLVDRVTFEVGDAVDLITNYPGPFDMIFIDVDKERYPEALELARARVRPGGYIVTDNVLWHGRVLDPRSPDPATQGVLAYTRAALGAQDLMTTILPLRDGVALHLKLAEPRRRR